MDVQICSLEFTIAGYKSNEVVWKELDLIISTETQTSDAWELINNYSEIINHTISIESTEYDLETHTISKFVFTVQLKRNPISAIFYVVVPTFAITIMSIMSYIIPSSEGMTKLDYLYSNFTKELSLVHTSAGCGSRRRR